MEAIERLWPTAPAPPVRIEESAAQKGGTDYALVLENGDSIKLDVKLRDRKYEGDLLLELEHEFEDGRREDGWARKASTTDWIVYVFDDGAAVRVPFEPMREALRKNEHAWRRKFLKKTGTGGFYEGWRTIFLVVPTDMLFRAIVSTWEKN